MDFPSLGFAAGQPTATATKAGKAVVGGKKQRKQLKKAQTVSVQELLKPTVAAATQSPFADDAVADAAMCWIPSTVVRAESWRLDKESDVLTTVYTCSGRHCRSLHRWRQFGRAAECLEHLAQEEGFRFLTCQHEGCGEVIWESRMRDHCAHAHPATKAQRLAKAAAARTAKAAAARKAGGARSVAARKAGRQAEAAAAPGGIVMRGNGWTKASTVASSAASDSGVSVTSSSAASAGVDRRQPSSSTRTELRRKVLAWDAVTMAGRSAPLVVKKHYCSHSDCSHSNRTFTSAAAVKDHVAGAHSQ